ncbi:MAG TPA: helix-turn-helix domain-containing protein [Pseudonocardia sp.]|jgi:AcrR family transcriptional regulator|uniref:TetR/AcrR family transcriptional regulator n=1 Tax=Pseudonocardia sp. TaxID=60912 RepID=UPI002B4ACEDF|nr:helix-turn-helix domain-containing protein [Pseudonocardia sp.]HLU56553.1 helix-turn-helix domain-containing protein [Pseudonocardia sp.]
MVTAEPRVERVLDSAAELLVRWGYQRVTIEDVARHAGIGKGTVYLHFRSKDALFVAVLLRVHRGFVERMTDRMAADPRAVLPSRMMRRVYEEMTADPVARTLYLGDTEVLGRLVHEASDTLGGFIARREEAVADHLRLLAEGGCLRPGLDADSALYVLTAVGTGFVVIDGMRSGIAQLDVPRAELLERTLANALEAADPPAGVLERVAPRIAQRYRSLLEHVDEEWSRRVR